MVFESKHVSAINFFQYFVEQLCTKSFDNIQTLDIDEYQKIFNQELLLLLVLNKAIMQIE